MTDITMEKLKKVYGEQVAVAETSMHLESGKFVVFLGPSGCGKTTTLNCIAGFEEPSAGRILFGDHDVTHLAPHERNVAMVFQSALLYPHLSAQRNVEMSLLYANIDAREQARRIKEMTDMLRIGHLMHKRPGALSGGERQRVALAKAMVRQPEVLLMDEPFSALDAALRNSLRSEVVQLQRKMGATTVFVTHDQVEAMTMGDIVVVMNAGRVQQVGSPQEIYENPINRFVAGFIGSPAMNLVDGHLQQRDGASYFICPHFELMLPDADKARRVAGAHGELTLGIRPQHMRVVDGAGPAGSARIHTSCYALERLGKENVVFAQSPDQTMWRVITAPQLQPALGDNLWLELQTEHIRLFGKE